MPVYIVAQATYDGIDSIPFIWPVLKTIAGLFVVWVVKRWFAGASNGSERNMHGKVVMVTGGTSGIGEAIIRDLATRGAQIVLLTQHALSDPFIVEYIEDVRNDTSNHLITAEQVDLSSLHSIRTFATKWIDNAPPRRLDMVILCANTITPNSKSGSQSKASTTEGVELNWQVNYLANFHLLSILSPALRAQPPDRDVRVLLGTCSSYLGGDLLHITQASTDKPSKPSKSQKTSASQQPIQSPTSYSPANAYATSKLALNTFAIAFQKHLSAHQRPDKMPANAKVILVDPGWTRTPGTRRWLSWGSLFGLALYLLLYPFWWVVLKSPDMGAQSFLFAAMEERFGRLDSALASGLPDLAGEKSTKKIPKGVFGDGGWLIKECAERPFLRDEVLDEKVQGQLWQYSENMIEEAERRAAEARARAKKEEKDVKEEKEAAEELRQYKEKVGKKDGERNEGSRRNRKAG